MYSRGGAVLVLLLVIAAVAAVPPAAAEHEPPHRYYVTGTVKNENGASVCGVTIRAADITGPNAEKNRTAATDGSGRYTIQLHMHSSAVPGEQNDEGHKLRVWLEGTQIFQDATALPNTENPSGWGQQAVDLVVPNSVTSAPCTVDLAIWGGAGVLIVLVGAVGVRRLRRPRAGTGSARSLRKVPGVGPTRARDLQEAGIRTPEELAKADPDEIAEATKMTRKQARVLVKRAQEFVGESER